MRKVYLRFNILILLFSIGFVLSVQSIQAQQPTKKQIDQSRKLANEGDKFFRQNNFKNAIDRYQKASNLVPNYNYPHLSYYKAYSHYNLREYDQALEDFSKALAQGYTPYEVYKVRWQIYYLKKDYDNALKDAEEVVKQQPSDSSLLVALGDMYQEKGMEREAIQYYEKAAPLIPNSGDILYQIAYGYSKLGNPTQQSEFAQKAIQKNTRFLGESWFLVGLTNQSTRKFSDAAEAYEKAISAKPDLVGAYTNLSQVYQILNRYDEAISILRRGINLNPNDGNMYISLAWFYSLANRHIEAIGAGKKAIELAPNEYMGYTNLCRAYNDVKEYNTAIQHCNTALKINPDDGETNFYLGRAYDFLNRTDLANTYYKKAVPGLVEFTKNNPDYSDGFYLLGNAYVSTNQVQNAIAAYKKSLALNPNFAKAISNLGYMYVLNKDKTAAKEQYNILAKLDTNLAAKLLQDIQDMK